MNRKLFLVNFIFVFTIGTTLAQFNPKEAKKSLVKVMVTGNGEAGVCTGFIWKQENWVVTSLHAMRHGATIRVQYLDQYWREGDISRVYKEADLVLIEVKGSVPDGIVPISRYDETKIPYNTNIHTIGYNNGAKGSSSRLLTKGFVDPETLDALVPKKDKDEIAKAGFPSLDLEIIYLDGSLLPGYSGSPVFDKDGDLVGIGNGGLESGQSNVSWVIPAKFLRELENSSQTSLPGNIEKASQAYSASTRVEVKEEYMDDLGAIEDQFEETYSNYQFGDYEFFWTKNRTFEELYESSLDPENLAFLALEFEENNLLVDYDYMHFDIFEEVNSGVVIAIPEDYELAYDDINGAMVARSTDPEDPGYFNMVFAGAADDFTMTTQGEAVEAIIQSIELNMGLATGGFTVDEEYSYTINIDDNYSITWLLMNGNNWITGADGYQYAISLYCTILLSNDRLFYTLSVATLPVEDFQYAMTYGIDCIENYDNDAYDCDLIEAYFKVMCAAHMTTFANKKVVRK
jgi:hypothetical protein